MSTDLAAWLLEQIAEDERAARAIPESDRVWRYLPATPANDDGSLDSEAVLDLERTVLPADPEEALTDGEARHIARWDPARVLAECDAKRRLVAMFPVSAPYVDTKGAFYGFQSRDCGDHRTVGSHRAWCYDCGEWCYPSMPCARCHGVSDVLRALALLYAGHPGYREEWRP